MLKYLNEVTKKYLKAGKPYSLKERTYLAEKMYQTNYVQYNVKTETLREILNSEFSFSDKPLIEQAKIWSYIFKNTKYMGVGHLAINFFKSYQKSKHVNFMIFWPLVKTWITSIDNWAHGDMIASLYSQMLEQDDSTIYPFLEKWSENKNPWKRRMSIISLFYYARLRKSYPSFKKVNCLLTPQLEVDHYYVQKAVGWTLRELTQAYPRETAKYMDKHLYKISSDAFSASIEKLPKGRKEELKKKRKTHRARK